MKSTVVIMISILASLSFSQGSPEADKWQHFRFLEGKWESVVTGKSGIGKGEREYSFIMDENYLQFKNKAVFEPQEKNPKGEVHEDWGIFSFDGNRQKFVLRQFHIEGFYNQYVTDSITDDGKTITLTTESVENGPKGMGARYIFKIENRNEFTEIFELAFPGKEFEECLVNHWKRKE